LLANWVFLATLKLTNGGIIEFFGQIFIVIGITLAIIGDIMIIIQAFKTSLLWGLGTLLMPLVGLVFIIIYWGQKNMFYGFCYPSCLS